MKWFRFYSEAMNDPKVQRLPAPMFKHWVNLLCLANEQEPRGTLPAVDDIAFVLRLNKQATESVLRELESQGLLDRQEDGSLQPHNWEARQRTKSDDVAARVKAHREKQVGNVTTNVTDNVTGNVTGNVSVTPLEEEERGKRKKREVDTSPKRRGKDARPPREIGEALIAEESEWMADLKARFPLVDWKPTTDKWLLFIEETPPTNWKLSFANWIEREDGYRQEREARNARPNPHQGSGNHVRVGAPRPGTVEYAQARRAGTTT